MDKPVISIVIPVHNKEKYISECLDSLIRQTYGLNNMEIICVNDGSTDSSSKILHTYAKKYSCIKIIDQNNLGVSTARNIGIKNSTGKYIVFLDADDMLSENSIHDIALFFDKNYEKTDIVTYPIYYFDEKKQHLQIKNRCENLKNSCIISINDYSDFSQTTINICIKNKKDLLFRNDLFLCEDQFFCTELIFRKKTIGFCQTAKYIYRRNIGGASELQHPYYTYDYFISFHKQLFELAGRDIEKVKYVKNLFLYSLSWRIKGDYFFPYHKNGGKEVIDVDMQNIINAIDTELILNNKWLIKEHKFYILGLKSKNRLFPILQDNKWWLCDSSGDRDNGKTITLAIRRERITGNTLTLMGFLKSQLFIFTRKPILKMNINGVSQIIHLYESSSAMYHSKIKTAVFWGFEIKITIHPKDIITFHVELDDKKYNVTYWFCEWNNLNSVTKNFIHFAKPISLEYSAGKLLCHAYNDIQTKHKNYLIALRRKHFGRYCLRMLGGFIKKLPIWLYSDYIDVFDNAYIQFRHDLKKNDHIWRFYIYAGDKKELTKKFTFWERLHAIKFKGLMHRILFIASQKILTSYAGLGQFIPFTKVFAYYNDIINFETIYLQHGVMHARCDHLYAKDRSPFLDRIVASTFFEISHFKQSLHFQQKDIIPTGMPRFTHLCINASRKTHKILFAPSWRAYLVKSSPTGWEGLEKFTDSDFYKNIMAFLTHSTLAQLLQRYNSHMDLKLHPNFHMYKNIFMNSSSYATLQDTINIGDYTCLITDFSSYQFDFLYLGIPVIHFLPDDTQVRAGLHTYREFIYPLEGNGIVTYSPNELLSALDRTLSSQSLMANDTKKSLFFPHKKNICEDVYRHIMRMEN